MSKPLRLVIFDVDGTLVDSQGDIVAAMTAAFAAVEAPRQRGPRSCQSSAYRWMWR